LFLFDRVKIYTGVGKTGNRSVTFLTLMTNEQNRPVAVAYSVLVAYNFLENHSIPVPAQWKKIFKETDARLMEFMAKKRF
jgi:acyl-CoA thioesterase FadM